MEDFIKRHEDAWGDNPLGLLEDYEYQPELTKKLDELDSTQLNEQTLLEIVLWKLNRYPQLDTSLLDELNAVGRLKAKQHRDAKDVLGRLLLSPGVRLPMASTILRFVNPDVFQIIDERAFRMLRPGRENYPDKPVVKKGLPLMLRCLQRSISTTWTPYTRSLPTDCHFAKLTESCINWISNAATRLVRKSLSGSFACSGWFGVGAVIAASFWPEAPTV